MQHVGSGDLHSSKEPIASTSYSSTSNPSSALAAIPNNNKAVVMNGRQQQQQLLHHHQAVQGTRPAILDLQDPLALQWSLAHLSSLIRKALRSIQGEDDVSSSSSSEDEDSSSDGGAIEEDRHETTGKAESSTTNARAQLQNLSSIVSNASSALDQQNKQTSQHHHHHRTDSKHDEGEGGYVRLLLNHGFDKSTAALERDIELERLRKENETLREMLAVANEVPAILPGATTT